MKTWIVRRQRGHSAYLGTVEFCENEAEAALAAAELLFDRAAVRRASAREYIAHGARRPGGEGGEVRFSIKEAKE